MTKWVDYIPRLALEVQMAPQDLKIMAIRQAAIEFCKLSLIWKQWQDPWGVNADTREIEVQQPDDARIHILTNATFDDTPLQVSFPKQMDEKFPEWRTTESGQPEYVLLTSPDNAALVPHTDTDGDLAVEAVLKPSESSLEGPDFLYEDHAETIIKGAKAYLMEIRRRPWSDPARGKELRMEFEDAARSANVQAGMGFTSARLRSSFQNR